MLCVSEQELVDPGGAVLGGLAPRRQRAHHLRPGDASSGWPSRAPSSGRRASGEGWSSACYAWSDIVLPPDRSSSCGDRRRGEVLQINEAWGFDRKLALGKGLNVLFAGPLGTGKTMAAEILAGELGLDLYKIDLSMVGLEVHRRDPRRSGRGSSPKLGLRTPSCSF